MNYSSIQNNPIRSENKILNYCNLKFIDLISKTMFIHLAKSHNPKKKYMVIVNGKIIHFGDSRYEDFTIHKDEKRKARYIKRHKKNEDWSLNGIDTAGWWSKNLLWNMSSIEESIEDIKKRFGIDVLFTKNDWRNLK